MKKALTSAALLAAIAGQAFAADLPSRKAPPTFVPPPPPPPLWTGFYVGVNAGYGFASNGGVALLQQGDATGGAIGASNTSFATSLGGGNNNGFIGGGQAGYNYQFGTSWLVGLEVDIQGIASGNNSVSAYSPLPIFQALTVTQGLDYLGTVRGRVGFLITPTILIYGTGGLAYGDANFSISGVQAVAIPGTSAGFFSGSYSDTRVGWTAGGGVEWLFLPNWSVKVEYLYFDLGSANLSNSAPSVNVFTGTNSQAVYGTPYASTKFQGNVVRAGVNYHFNWAPPAPVVAKY
ncbi:MAG TPA: outer membrane beta-barrel protein [Methylocystis sp.]|nr:outer membrane beta-barrel protein [Methylocystis sp.]